MTLLKQLFSLTLEFKALNLKRDIISSLVFNKGGSNQYSNLRRRLCCRDNILKREL